MNKKLLIPVFIAILTGTLTFLQYKMTKSQNELQKNDQEETRQMKYVDIFYKEITNDDKKRQFIALALLEQMHLRPGYLTILSEFVDDKQQLSEIRSEAQSAYYKIMGKLKITSPSDGDMVGMTEFIQGETPFTGLNHYIVVTPLKAGADLVQDKPAKISGISMRGKARFGTATVGSGEKFSVRFLVTSHVISPGSLTEKPEDGLPSNTITVTRK